MVANMIHDVVAAEYRGDYRIEVHFDDGRHGVVDFAEYLDKGGVFTRFRDLEFFKRFHLDKEFGVLAWEGGIDIAPETLCFKATGLPLPKWMSVEPSQLSLHTP